MMILKNRRDRFAFTFGRQSGIRTTSEVVEQLSEQLRKERAQHRFDLAEKEKELALMLRELSELRLELARRETIAAFALASSPSASLH
jgi:hypothetical protein